MENETLQLLHEQCGYGAILLHQGKLLREASRELRFR
jgi:hypothetical protein